jgi:hypothetical protein
MVRRSPVPAPRITAADLEAWRRDLYLGRPLDAGVARRLLGEVEALRDEVARARTTFAAKAAAALETRLQVVATFNHGGCRMCRDAEARAFLAKLRRIADEARPAVPLHRSTVGSSRSCP